MATPPEQPRPTFPALLRVRHGAHFERAYKLRKRRDAGIAVVYAAPNGLPRPRLGLSVSRKVGPAVARNAIKRLLREAFRLERASLPKGLDFVVVVRPHPPRHVRDYRALLVRCATELAAGLSGDGTGS